jgi:hypothetical protein
MLDPFNALSLAAAVVQFIDYSTKVIVKAKQIYDTGSDLETLRLRAQANDLKSLNEDLGKRERLMKAVPNENNSADPTNPLGEFDQPLYALDVFRSWKEEKNKKAKKELVALEDRLQKRKGFNDTILADCSRHEKRLTGYADDLFNDLMNREMVELTTAGRLAKSEQVCNEGKFTNLVLTCVTGTSCGCYGVPSSC